MTSSRSICSKRPFVREHARRQDARSPRDHHRHRREANYLGLPSEEAYKNRGVSALCRLRRCPAAVPQQAAGRRRRRRLGGRRGDVPHEVRVEGSHDPPPRRAAGQHDHAGASAWRTPRSRWSGTSTLDEVLGNDKDGVTGVRLASTNGRRDAQSSGQRHVPGHRPHAEHGLSQGPGRAERQGLHQVDGALPHEHQRRRRVRRRRRGRRLLPAGDHLRRHRLHGAPLDAERWLAAKGIALHANPRAIG